MENKSQQNSTPQSIGNTLDEKQMNTGVSDSNIADEDIEPVLDEEDMKENHLKEEDLDNIVWDKPAQPDQDLSKSEIDITD